MHAERPETASNPRLGYTPDAGFGGTDSFTYKASDGQADSNVATVNITVEPVEEPPECAISGTGSRVFLRGTSGDDVICANGGDDVILATKGGNDTLEGGEGDDTLNGSGFRSGTDALDGEGGTDTCRADQGDTRTNCER